MLKSKYFNNTYSMITLVNKYKDDFAGYNLMDLGVKKIGPGSNLNTPIRKEL